MTKQEIIDAFDVARRMQGLMELLPETLIEAHNQMSDAVSEILCDVVDAEDAIDIILQALRAPADPGQLREAEEKNEMLQWDLETARRLLTERGEEIEKLTATLDGTRNQLRATEDELAYYKKQTLAAYTAVDEDPEDADTDDEPGEPEQALQVQRSTEGTAPAKKKRAVNGWHRWTDEEDAWIANHLNSATSRDVAEKFGVSPKAAYTRMLAVKERLGK